MRGANKWQSDTDSKACALNLYMVVIGLVKGWIPIEINETNTHP